jgi:hypothetical protein
VAIEDERRELIAILHAYQRGTIYTEEAADKIIALRPKQEPTPLAYEYKYHPDYGA